MFLPTNYSFTNNIFNIDIYQKDLTLNNQQGMICIVPTNQPTKKPTNEF